MKQANLLTPKRSAPDYRTIAIFAAFSMFAATLEYLFPRPVPFFRLGLANLPVIMALPILDFPSMILLTLLKVIGQAIVNGTLASYVFLLSLTGSFASFFLMYLCYRLMGEKISYIGISLAGALASNTIQSLFSVLVIFGREAWVILPLFYGLGFAAGLVIGILAEIFSGRSRWFFHRYELAGERGRVRWMRSVWKERERSSSLETYLSDGEDVSDDMVQVDRRSSAQSHRQQRKNARRARRRPAPDFLLRNLSTPAAFLTGVILIPLYLATSDPLMRLIQVLFLAVFTVFSGKRLFYLYFIFMLSSVMLFNMFVPQGRVLFTLGSVAVTEGALLSGLQRGLTIIGLVFISLFSIRKDLRIPGSFGRMVADTLRNFEYIYEFRKGASISGLIHRLDRVLYELESLDSSASNMEVENRSSRFRLTDIPIALVIITAVTLPFIVQL